MKFYIDNSDLKYPLEILKPMELHDIAEIQNEDFRCIFHNQGRDLILSLYDKYGIDVLIFIIIHDGYKISKYPLLINTLTITSTMAECYAKKYWTNDLW